MHSARRGRSRLLGDPHGERPVVSTLGGIFRDSAERAGYVRDSFERIQVVLELLAGLRGQGITRVLELGANPYVLTTLLRRRFDFDLELANYFGDDPPGSGPFTHGATCEGQPVAFSYRHFNIEQDPFPYADGTFECVLFCEILEHLLLDPERAVAEMARVLRPGGHLLLSTPNATRLPNLYFLALGRSIWDGYSANGPYGRHNREYTLKEAIALVERHGFKVEQTQVRNVQALARRFTYLQWLRPDVWYEHLFLVACRSAADEPSAPPPASVQTD